MSNQIDCLFELCKERPFDIQKIKDFISENQMSGEDVTRVALKLCDHGMFSYSEYLYQHEKEPQPHELVTYNWEKMFDVLIENGLDPSLVICEDGINYENVLCDVLFFDDGDLGARILRNILSKNGNPNIKIGESSLFQTFDADFTMDIQMGLFSDERDFERVFHCWLVLIGFGGVIEGGKLPVTMCEDNFPCIFKEFERFGYRLTYKKNDYELQIIDKETDTVVSIL